MNNNLYKILAVLIIIALGYLFYSNYKLKQDIINTKQKINSVSSDNNYLENKLEDTEYELEDANNRIDDLESNYYY